MSAVTPETFKFLLLKNAQQLRLQRERYVADFVEKKGPFVSQFKTADFLRDGSGESASLMAKELTFEQIEGDGGTIQLDERATISCAYAQLCCRQGSLIP